MSVTPNMNADDPASEERNQHHTWSTGDTWGYRSEQDWQDELFGRGPGDPDTFGLPEQDDLTTHRRPEL